ncbi:hypothetical protein [Streptomyces sp. E2N166]|uniref:hypothetical protein n=1 Tax=Streptomyces sp. E2N166 TaxID=1851909 RepID=UPI000EF66E14|nr:hypothetical protein [Streptomyces sp. E2N166]
MARMPAGDTPRFTWPRTHLLRHAQPAPRSISRRSPPTPLLRAADRSQRREYRVGASTVVTLLADAVVPGLLDRHLARTAFDWQQTDAQPSPEGPGNLFAPADDSDLNRTRRRCFVPGVGAGRPYARTPVSPGR